MSDVKLVNYGELDCVLSDYLATDGVVMETAISLSEMVDDILKLVNECSYPIQAESTKKDETIAKLRECVDIAKEWLGTHEAYEDERYDARDRISGILKELEGGE